MEQPSMEMTTSPTRGVRYLSMFRSDVDFSSNVRMSLQFEPKYFRAELLKLDLPSGTMVTTGKINLLDDSESEENEPKPIYHPESEQIAKTEPDLKCERTNSNPSISKYPKVSLQRLPKKLTVPAREAKTKLGAGSKAGLAKRRKTIVIDSDGDDDRRPSPVRRKFDQLLMSEKPDQKPELNLKCERTGSTASISKPKTIPDIKPTISKPETTAPVPAVSETNKMGKLHNFYVTQLWKRKMYKSACMCSFPRCSDCGFLCCKENDADRLDTLHRHEVLGLCALYRKYCIICPVCNDPSV